MNKDKVKLAVLVCSILVIIVLVIVGISVGMDTPVDQGQTKPSTSQIHQQTQNTDPKYISFPYAIPNTNLVIQKIDSYDGVFLEDGSDRNVTGISTIVLVNNGNTAVEYADITLHQDGKELRFRAATLPAGGTLVVQESSCAEHIASEYTACSANVTELDTLELSTSQVKVEEIENGTLLVTNLTDETIPCVRVFYKFALKKGQIYVGGITYTAKLTNLEPGQSKKLTASHFAPGSSEVVMVRTYENAE